MITTWTLKHTAGEVMARLQRNGVAAGLVQNAADLAESPLLRARGFFMEDTSAPFMDATPVRMSAARAEYRRRAPAPGQDNDYVYGELLDISEKERAELKEKGVI
jgi:crotonobetainyl-CoA:carnitine CoA-transferase CaiB-like acyl-CoA transferase